MEDKRQTEPGVRHEHDVDEAMSHLFPRNCPSCRSGSTARDVPWLQYALLLVLWLAPLNLQLISAHGDRRITWFIFGLVACILAVWFNPGRYCRKCGTRFRRIYKRAQEQNKPDGE